jgi:integration host factor subunit beta
MTKREIIEELLTRNPRWGHREAEIIVNSIFDAMAEGLARGERIEIRGFGSFALRYRRAREGRNPKTGKTVAVTARQAPFFRAGKELRAEVKDAAKRSSDQNG